MRKGRAIKALFILVITGLVIVVLSALVQYRFSLSDIWRDAKIAARALKIKYSFQVMNLVGKEKYVAYKDLWYKTDRSESGVTIYSRQKAQDGLTFYTDHTSSAYLVDMEGNVVHEWHKPFSEVWPDPKHIMYYVPDELIHWRKAELMPNGDVLAIYEGMNQVPYGGGIIKLDSDSNLIWKLDINAHHDLDVTSTGRIITLMHTYETPAVLGRPIISDGLALISPDGKLIITVRFLDLLYRSRYSELFDWDVFDPFHANNIEELSADMAGAFPEFHAGDLLVSMLTPSAMFVLDGSDLRPKMVIAKWSNAQHDPDFMPDGSIRIFDNLGCRTPGVGASRIIDVNQGTNTVTWMYEGTVSQPFYSENRGSQQTLENGDILITESTKGRIFEITPAGEIVWEYINPSLEGQSIGVVHWATRHRRGDLTFLEQNGR